MVMDVAPAKNDIPDDARILEIPLHLVTDFLSTLKRTACGPGELPYYLISKKHMSLVSV